MSPSRAEGSLKRRQSSSASTDSKRPRLNYGSIAERDGELSQRANGTALARPVRKPSGQAERQRGKRLFGALLGTLSQTKTTAAQKRRAEIEQKQQEKLRQQTEEDEAERRVRLEKLGRRRRRQQWDWEEQSLKVRHQNMRFHARMLKTNTEPYLYYLPYKTLEKEEDKIKSQRDAIEDDIDKEVHDFEEQRAVALDALDREDTNLAMLGLNQATTNGHNTESATDPDNAIMTTDSPGQSVPLSDDAVPEHTNGLNAHTDPLKEENNHQREEDSLQLDQPSYEPAQQSPQLPAVVRDLPRDIHDDAGEVVEGEEDTVIY